MHWKETYLHKIMSAQGARILKEIAKGLLFSVQETEREQATLREAGWERRF